MEDIDFVITWVDGSDPAWRSERQKYASREGDQKEVRFRDWGLLRYWFRGVAQYAPWVRKIHFVTWGHVPDWLDDGNPKLHIVKHSDFIPPEYLPTFNSHTIELNLHRIPGLAEQFVYFNDDFFITKEVSPSYFFQNGLPCDCFGLYPIYFSSDSIGWIAGSDIAVINDHFQLREVVRKHWRKCLSLRNGWKKVIKTLCLLICFSYFPGLYHWHLPFCFQKSTFERVWRSAYNPLEATCLSTFREMTNVSPMLIKFWQLAEGAFHPRGCRHGRCFHLQSASIEKVCESILSKTYRLICINDHPSVEDLEDAAARIREAFAATLPNRCSFERQ